jgi:hypothetical protein
VLRITKLAKTDEVAAYTAQFRSQGKPIQFRIASSTLHRKGGSSPKEV